ncbi:MAG: hypothetical protein EPN57_16725 [Paraburkholderia sp.]|nr:MAG: hypothetical protein EPN57_16725 [Paraburkholderia sp.]
MRSITAALLGAAATLPSLAHATTTPTDPADPSASVPALTAPSAFAGYQPYRDGEGPSWQQLNRAVTAKPMRGARKNGMQSGMTGDMKHGTLPAEPAADGRESPSMREDPLK